MPHRGCAGDETVVPEMRRRHGFRGREDFLGQAFGAWETQQALDSAQRGTLVGPFGDGHPGGGDAADDLVEGVVVIELRADCADVLSVTAFQQESAW